MKPDETTRRRLRGLAHPLKPCVQVGAAGVTSAVIAEIEGALRHHQLLKVRVRAHDRPSRDAAIREMVEKCGAELVSRIGNVAVLYRRNPDRPDLTGQEAPGQT
jgi:RNA-binding protein